MIGALLHLTSLPIGVRYAFLEDVEEMAVKGQRFFDATILKNYLDYDVPSMIKTIGRLVSEDGAVAFCWEQDGQIVGGIGGMLTPMYFNENEIAAQQLFFFVLPEYRNLKSLRLLQAWEQWATHHGAKVIWSGAKMDDHYQGMQTMMARRGYAPLETVFIREV